MTHIRKKLKISFAIKEKNVMKLLKVTFQKSQKVLAENLRERPPIQNISIAIGAMYTALLTSRHLKNRDISVQVA